MGGTTEEVLHVVSVSGALGTDVGDATPNRLFIIEETNAKLRAKLRESCAGI